MEAQTWLSSNVEYGRKLVESGLAGATLGRKEFLRGEEWSTFLQESFRRALKLTAVAGGLGATGAWLTARHRGRAANTLLFGIAGAALGFVGGLTWETRRFLASIVRRAVKDVNQARDEHWLEKNPIDYA